jgi:beta-lactamase class A
MSRSSTSANRRAVLGSIAGLAFAGIPELKPSVLAAAKPEIDIPALIAASDAIHGIVVIGPTDAVRFQRNTWCPFVSASLYKLVLLTEILRAVEAGKLKLDQQIVIEESYWGEANGEDAFYARSQIGTTASLEEMVYATGAWSSNVAALALLNLTSVDRLNEFSSELGMTGTRYWATETEIPGLYPSDEGALGCEDLARSISYAQSFAAGSYINLTTPADMAWFFRLLRDDALVSELTSWRLKGVLSSRAITDRIPARLPPDVGVAHKTGNLTGVLHDAGIISANNQTSIVVAMAQAVTNIDQAFAIEQQLGLIGYELLLDQG